MNVNDLVIARPPLHRPPSHPPYMYRLMAHIPANRAVPSARHFLGRPVPPGVPRCHWDLQHKHKKTNRLSWNRGNTKAYAHGVLDLRILRTFAGPVAVAHGVLDLRGFIQNPLYGEGGVDSFPFLSSPVRPSSYGDPKFEMDPSHLISSRRRPYYYRKSKSKDQQSIDESSIATRQSFQKTQQITSAENKKQTKTVTNTKQ